MTTYLYLFHREASNQLSTFLFPRNSLSTIGEIPGEFLHCSILQNHVYPNPRSPSIESKYVSQETEASVNNLDRSTDDSRPNYARVCLATPSIMHMDTSINADESDLFGTPSDIEASPTRQNRQFLQSQSEMQGQLVTHTSFIDKLNRGRQSASRK